MDEQELVPVVESERQPGENILPAQQVEPNAKLLREADRRWELVLTDEHVKTMEVNRDFTSVTDGEMNEPAALEVKPQTVRHVGSEDGKGRT